MNERRRGKKRKEELGDGEGMAKQIELLYVRIMDVFRAVNVQVMSVKKSRYR